MKYSVLPESNNATIRLRCYAAPVNNRSAVANSFLIGKSLSQNTLHKEDEKEFSVDVSKRLRPSAPINDAPKVCEDFQKSGIFIGFFRMFYRSINN
jgi:hypothetical protein